MEFANVNFMQPLPSKVISPETETAMKELVEKYRPVLVGMFLTDAVSPSEITFRLSSSKLITNEELPNRTQSNKSLLRSLPVFVCLCFDLFPLC